MTVCKCAVLVFACLFTSPVHGQMGKSTIQKDGSSSGTISMGPPDLSDEETQANFMPTKLRCEACVGIANRFANALKDKIAKYKSVKDGKRQLSEDTLIDLFENVCADKEWSGFGIKEVSGVKHLIYPGSTEAEVPGIMQGGGPWPRRLSDMCYRYVGDHDEYGIYKAHVHRPEDGIVDLLCATECNSTKSQRKKKRPKNEL